MKINELLNSQSNNSFFKDRYEKNVTVSNVPSFEKEVFWKAMIACLLSSQQRSGPESALTRFCSTVPFPLNLEKCTSSSEKLDDYVENILKKFGGIRRTNIIGKQVKTNFIWLNDNGWDQIEIWADKLIKNRKRKPEYEDFLVERNAANFFNENLVGFGPKQSRNLWQTMGMTRYEIPIDSRIIKWLNKTIFPFKLSSGALSDRNYYEFVINGIQEVCNECKIVPCLLDAAIFSSYDSNWDKKNIW